MRRPAQPHLNKGKEAEKCDAEVTVVTNIETEDPPGRDHTLEITREERWSNTKMKVRRKDFLKDGKEISLSPLPTEAKESLANTVRIYLLQSSEN